MKNNINSTPQDIGPVEYVIQTIVVMTKRMFKAQKLEKLFWMEAMVKMVYILNQCPTRTLHSITPEETWSDKRPCIAHMRVFGSIAYAMLPNKKKGKLDAKGIKCMFIGYYEGMKVYRLMCLETKKFIKSLMLCL